MDKVDKKGMFYEKNHGVSFIHIPSRINLWNRPMLYHFCVIGFLSVFFLLLASSKLHSASPDSFIRCSVEGGNIPVRATIIEYFPVVQETYMQVTKHFWEKEKKSIVKKVTIPSAEYQKLWDWVEAESVWNLKDVTFKAEDAPTYTFQLKRAAKEKTITAMSVSTLENKKYYFFYSILKELQKKYLPE